VNTEITACNGGTEAIEFYDKFIKSKETDKLMIFQDIHMPFPNGVDVIKYIRKIEKDNKIENLAFIIACSAYSNRESIIPPIMSGSDLFFKKQISLSTLKNELIKVEFWDKSKIAFG
jgi:CheY-like chemotaxis protein